MVFLLFKKLITGNLLKDARKSIKDAIASAVDTFDSPAVTNTVAYTLCFFFTITTLVAITLRLFENLQDNIVVIKFPTQQTLIYKNRTK